VADYHAVEPANVPARRCAMVTQLAALEIDPYAGPVPYSRWPVV
jgi:hypothetical protein